MNTSTTPIVGPGDEDRISRAILASRFNDRELARKLGVSVSSANAYRYGNRKPSSDRLCRLARVLGVDVRDLLRSDTGEAA